MACVSLGSQAAAVQQVPVGATRQALWAGGRAGLPQCTGQDDLFPASEFQIVLPLTGL